MSAPFRDSAEEDEAFEREQAKVFLAFLAGTGATVEGFLTATESALDDPAEQAKREKERQIMHELQALLDGEGSQLRNEMREFLGQSIPEQDEQNEAEG